MTDWPNHIFYGNLFQKWPKWQPCQIEPTRNITIRQSQGTENWPDNNKRKIECVKKFQRNR